MKIEKRQYERDGKENARAAMLGPRSILSIKGEIAQTICSALNSTQLEMVKYHANRLSDGIEELIEAMLDRQDDMK